MSTGDVESCNWSSGNRDNHLGCEVSLTLTPGVYVYTLTVTDINGDTDLDEIIITVNPEENNAPLANISNTDLVFQADHSGIPENDVATITLNGSESSDDEEDDISLFERFVDPS